MCHQNNLPFKNETNLVLNNNQSALHLYLCFNLANWWWTAEASAIWLFHIVFFHSYYIIWVDLCLWSHAYFFSLFNKKKRKKTNQSAGYILEQILISWRRQWKVRESRAWWSSTLTRLQRRSRWDKLELVIMLKMIINNKSHTL